MLISTQRENSTHPSDPLVDSLPGIPSDFVGWSDPIGSDRIRYRINSPWS